MYEVLLEALTAFLSANLIAIAYWSFSKKPRRALRIIDLMSYVIAAAALSSSLLALKHYDQRINTRNDETQIKSLIAGLQTGGTHLIEELCTAESLVNPSRARECKRMKTYLDRNVFNLYSYSSTKLDLPNGSSEPLMQPFVRRLVRAISFINIRSLEKAEADNSLPFEEKVEYSLIRAFIAIVAFAFGLGLARRSIDLYTDW